MDVEIKAYWDAALAYVEDVNAPHPDNLLKFKSPMAVAVESGIERYLELLKSPMTFIVEA